MGLFNYLKNRLTQWRYARALSGGAPIFTQFGEDIYASDIVQSVIQCIVTEMTKLKPLHIRRQGRDTVPVNSDIQRLLNNPNELMTTHDFISKIMWNLYLNYNAIIYPTYDTIIKDGVVKKKYTGLYPLQPHQVDFIEDKAHTLYIRLRFLNGLETTLPYSDVIHVRYQYSVSDFMGGNSQGQPDNNALLKMLNLDHQMTEGIVKAMKTSYNVNALLKYNTMFDRDKMEEDIADFNNRLRNNESGILGVDMKTEYIPINRSIQMVDAETLKFIDSRILRKFGVSLPILTGDYTKEQYQAFYQKTLEPLIINLSQAFGKVLFTQREKDMQNEIMFTAEDLIFMSSDQVLEAIRLLGDSGALLENEKRIAIGLPPLEELAGVRMMSLNYVNVDIANQYQVGANAKPDGEEEKDA